MQQKNNKDYSLLLIAVIFFIAALCSCKDAVKPVKEPVSIEYFKDGEILLPDYAITDTLIVRDAAGLNKEVALFEQGIKESTDGEIAATFYKYCTIK